MLTEDHRPPTSDELISRAEALIPLLRQNAPTAEALRRLPDDTVQALDDAGIFRMAQPVRHGGYGTDVATIAEVMTSIASGCASTTWVLMIYNSVAYLAELLSEEALADIYAGPRPKLAGAFGTTGAVLEREDGGFRVRERGRWPFNSGCHHAAWDLLRVMVEEPDGTSWPAFAAVPMADLTIGDDWQVMGALGTGSATVTCGAMFLPEHRVAPITGDARSATRPDLSAAQNVALPLGMARHAFEAFMELARTRGINHLGYERMVDAPVVHTAVARSAANIKLIESYQQWALSAVDPSAGRLPPKDAAVLSVGAARCFQLARETIEDLYTLCPSTEIHLGTPIQRLVRDIHVFEHQHAISPFTSYELYGRRLCAS